LFDNTAEGRYPKRWMPAVGIRKKTIAELIAFLSETNGTRNLD
jgi:hypothetical protein